MNAEEKKSIPTAYIYAIRVRTLDEHYSYGAPFVARDDQQACELVARSLSSAKEENEIAYDRGELLCLASYTLWSEDAANPITKRDVRRGGYIVANCQDLMMKEVIK